MAWRGLREIDQACGWGKGEAFRRFKREQAGWCEGRDYRRLDALSDADEIARLKAAGQVYASSHHVVLIAAARTAAWLAVPDAARNADSDAIPPCHPPD
ncbi:MAG TPA: hypothetical protein VFV27_00405 [Nevskiaceae bacterium]|nr:hypothetical protein [Nevskiaceae bacterium]